MTDINMNEIGADCHSNETLSKKQIALSDFRSRKCLCYPTDRSIIEFPAVWNELRQNRQLFDGSVTCDDGITFQLHRVILSAVSSQFKNLFTNSLNRQLPERTDIKINTSSHLFSLILDYAYSGQCVVTEQNISGLLSVADAYEVLGVLQLCCHYLLKRLRPDNCLNILKFGSQYFCKDMEKAGKIYMLNKFKDIMEASSDDIVKLNSDELANLLKDDELNVRNEEIVFEAVKKWIECDVQTRRHDLLKLLSCVRFGLMSFPYFSHNVLIWKPFNEEESCKELKRSVMKFLTDLDRRSGNVTDLMHPLARPRIPHEVLFAVGGWTAGSPTNFVETYDTRADRWLLSRNTDGIARAYHGLVALDGLIYMIGGFDGNEHFNTVRCFDPIKRLWIERACMYNARCYVSITTLDGKIYAMGGYNGRIRMNSVERYDPNRNQWELVAPMERQRSDASAATLQRKIYIVGGFNGHEVLNSAEMYDPALNQWTFIPSMTSARSGVSLVAYRDSLFALGGFNGFTRLSTGEKYTPGGSTEWVEVMEMFSPRSNFATVILDDLIFVIGGFNGTTTIAYVECYDADLNEWYDSAPMNLNRSALSACVIAGLPNVRDYSFVSKNSSSEGRGFNVNQGDR